MERFDRLQAMVELSGLSKEDLYAIRDEAMNQWRRAGRKLKSGAEFRWSLGEYSALTNIIEVIFWGGDMSNLKLSYSYKPDAFIV